MVELELNTSSSHFLELLVQHNGTDAANDNRVAPTPLVRPESPHDLDYPDTTGHHSEADRFQNLSEIVEVGSRM